MPKCACLTLCSRIPYVTQKCYTLPTEANIYMDIHESLVCKVRGEESSHREPYNGEPRSYCVVVLFIHTCEIPSFENTAFWEILVHIFRRKTTSRNACYHIGLGPISIAQIPLRKQAHPQNECFFETVQIRITIRAYKLYWFVHLPRLQTMSKTNNPNTSNFALQACCSVTYILYLWVNFVAFE